MSIILAVNAGSSSLKLALIEGEQQRAAASAKLTEGQSITELVEPLLGELTATVGVDAIDAIGHRIVHGGTLRQSVRFDSATEQALEAASALAPLHNPPALAVLRKLASLLPDRPQVCVFDTSFFSTLDESAWRLPVPYEWFSEWGIRRFGFHGINHEHMVNRAMARCARRPLRVISLHLGSGCSATASLNGAAVATTMGYTPMDGLMMGTRSGALDPGVLIALLKERLLDLATLEDQLLHRSGLRGVSGISGDFRSVEQAAIGGNSRAKLALTLFASSIRQQIGAYMARLGGADALVFSGGIGENSAALRAEVCSGLEELGLSLEGQANATASGECCISAEHSKCTILVVPASEEVAVARETNLVLR